MPATLNRSVRTNARTFFASPRQLLKGKDKKVDGRGRPCLDGKIQRIIRSLRNEGATLQIIASVCSVSYSTVSKYCWSVPHRNRMDVAMKVSRKTGKRM